MPDNKSRPPQEEPWENGWAPDTSRAPGTRRLWLAGALAVATIVACVTAIAVNDKASDKKDENSEARQGQTKSDETSGGGLISFATPSAGSTSSSTSSSTAKATATATGGGESASPSAGGSASSSPAAGGGATPHTSAEASASPTRKPADPKPPTSYERSVRSVNYPDRYWHVSDGVVKLDPVRGSESREDSTFTVVKGLADSSCYSFKTADGTYLRHRNFVLRAERNDGSTLFQKDATFCSRASSYSGAVMLESVNYPGRYLRHKNFQLRLDSYQNSDLYRADASFRVVDALS
ncbi:AbfB domain-containing protein [Streptomyces sp. NBC_01275]|uniref:AbfB domain-containing protein n=1 Tax=Streptomyces sp. NBC_01275 TaxID=2903807 RepID=UPI002253B706|nr:AbfB domain-containing protein [Streptomyces sp. NBC_01275]MCX4761116.1 AbfB domain-containing protein [Streptomyces sp. NBC_01275]